MSNRYIVYMTKAQLVAPLGIVELIDLFKKWDAEIFTNVADALASARPLVKTYQMVACGVNVEGDLRGVVAGEWSLIASGQNRYLYILKLDDQHSIFARNLIRK
ncbi:MAG: hypothetical protein SFZ02_19295 [bacterium]|nr:hypothetical protein [bacterium]